MMPSSSLTGDPPDLLLGPYVTRVTAAAATVLWLPRAEAADPGRVFVHPAGGGAPVAAPARTIKFPPGPETLRAADLTGLTAGARVVSR